MTIPTIYARVVEARPELAVDRLRFEPSVMWGSWYRCELTYRPDYESKYGAAFRWLHTDEATALIESHWLRALPSDTAVIANGYARTPIDAFAVVLAESDRQTRYLNFGPSRIECLAEYHVPGSTREVE